MGFKLLSGLGDSLREQEAAYRLLVAIILLSGRGERQDLTASLHSTC